MKITIEFQDKDEAILALHAPLMLEAIKDLDHYLRNKLKHAELSEPAYDAYQDARKQLLDYIDTHYPFN